MDIHRKKEEKKKDKNSRGPKSQHKPDTHPLQQPPGEMPQDVQRREQDHKVHPHVPDLGREHERRAAEEAPRSGDSRRPLGPKGVAAGHARDEEAEVADVEQGEERIAQALVRGHDAHAHVLEEDGELEEVVR